MVMKIYMRLSEVAPKSGTHFCTSWCRIGIQKGIKTRRSYGADFKQEAAALRWSDCWLPEGVPRKFQRRLELLKMWVATPALYRWKRMTTMKTKTKNGQSEDNDARKLAAENARLRAEVERLKTDREILKSQYSGLLLNSLNNWRSYWDYGLKYLYWNCNKKEGKRLSRNFLHIRKFFKFF